MLETSAGAIVYTIINNEIYYLLIQDFHNNWGFPKGHLENKETLVQAAIREIKEEVGINITLDPSFMDECNYKMNNGIDKRSVYFLGYYENQEVIKQVEEVQSTKLLNYEDTLKQLTFNNMKQVLIKANTYLKNGTN